MGEAPGRFGLASRIHKTAEHTYVVRIPDGWQQGRGAFGGLVLGSLLRAIESEEPDRARRTRNVTAELCGPVQPGEATLEVTTLRSGNRLSCYNATLRQGEGIHARLSATLSTARALSAPQDGPTIPNIPSYESIAPFPMDGAAKFAQHYEFRNTGPVPFSASPKPSAAGWVAERDFADAFDTPRVLAFLDTWWPAVLTQFEKPRFSATISFAAQFFVDPAELPHGAPLYFVGRPIAENDGFVLEYRELWCERRLVAINQQTFALLA